MTSPIQKREQDSSLLLDYLFFFQGALVTPLDKDQQEEVLLIYARSISTLINQFEKDMLPYAVLTQFVYEQKEDEGNGDISYLISQLEEKFSFLYEVTDPIFVKFIKLMEHLKLAKLQKDYLFTQQKDEIERLSIKSDIINKQIDEQSERFRAFEDEIEQSSIKSEAINEQIDKQSERFKDIESEQMAYFKKIKKEVQKLKDNIKGITAQFITILGIFAAILLGSFGALQGFASLFASAAGMELWKILIISALGASSVLLILFFLLNGIAKLTGKPLSSADEGSIIVRYPVITLSYGVLVLIALIGVALRLGKANMEWTNYYLWWGIPAAWMLYFSRLVKKLKKEPVGNKPSAKEKSNESGLVNTDGKSASI